MANSMRIGVALEGFAELQALLKVLPARTEQNVVGVSLEAAAAPIERRARALAPVRSGALKKSITHALRKYKNRTMVIIGPDKAYYDGGQRLKKGASAKGKDRPANYAHLVEFGHIARNGAENAKARKFIRFTAKERQAAALAGNILPTAVRRAVTFVPPRPFLRPAVEQGKQAAAEAFRQGMTRGLEREIKKLNRKVIKAAGRAA